MILLIYKVKKRGCINYILIQPLEDIEGLLFYFLKVNIGNFLIG